MFNDFTNEFLNMDTLTNDPFTNLNKLKRAMFSAAVDIKYYAQQQRRPNTVAEKLYWTVLLRRAVRSGAVSSACRAAQAYPYLEQFFSMDSHLIYDLNGLTYHVNELAGQDIENASRRPLAWRSLQLPRTS